MLTLANKLGVDPNSLSTTQISSRDRCPRYTDITLATNNLYSNYNALQATWVRTKGRYIINMNYTMVRRWASRITPATFDQYNLANNYGVLPTNRPQIFNAAYSIELGNPTHNKALGFAINGWQLSGITQLQSGANLTGFSSNQNFGASATVQAYTGNSALVAPNLTNLSLLGSPDIQLNPIETCNPTANLATHQYINPSCFTFPTKIGQNGPSVLPPIYGPAFFNSDLGIFKNIQLGEGARKLQFRFNAYNFLNHPLWSFNGSNLNLGFNVPTTANGGYGTPVVSTTGFGTVTEKQGHRVVQAAIKFYF